MKTRECLNIQIAKRLQEMLSNYHWQQERQLWEKIKQIQSEISNS